MDIASVKNYYFVPVDLPSSDCERLRELARYQMKKTIYCQNHISSPLLRMVAGQPLPPTANQFKAVRHACLLHMSLKNRRHDCHLVGCFYTLAGLGNRMWNPAFTVKVTDLADELQVGIAGEGVVLQAVVHLVVPVPPFDVKLC